MLELQERVASCGTSLCLGIDPHVPGAGSFFAEQLRGLGSEAYLTRFGEVLIEVAAGQLPAVKLQSSFFECHGDAGYRALKHLFAHAKQNNLLAIYDAKRGDITSTMSAYCSAAFDWLGADVLTVLPYLGMDTLDATSTWLKRGKGIYVVWRSSNPSGVAIQAPIQASLLAALTDWKKAESLENVGLVLGATQLTALDSELLSQLAAFPLLVPGVGAQGADFTEAVRRTPGSNNLFPVSRGLTLLGDRHADLSGIHSWQDYADQVQVRITAMLNN